MDDKTKLAIRDEVETRVEKLETTYWKFGGLLVAIIAFFCFLLWRAQINEVRRMVAEEISKEKVKESIDFINTKKSEAVLASESIKSSAELVKKNETEFLNRLAGIKGADNVVLGDDLSKIFVSQVVTNAEGDNKIQLYYEPIPHTIVLRFNTNGVPLERFGTLMGQTILLNPLGARVYARFVTNNTLHVEYVRRSLR